MKRLLSISILSIAALLIGTSGHAGIKEGGGGDASEMGVDQIRGDILNWIIKGGAAGLKNWPEGLNYDRYIEQMKIYLAPHYVVIGFVSTAQEKESSDPELKVVVDGQPKSCRGFVSIHDNLPHVLCNIERYPTGGADQYRLIHHEFAGLAGIERNIAASSDYWASQQLTEYLMPETVFRLSVTPQKISDSIQAALNAGPSCYLAPYNLPVLLPTADVLPSQRVKYAVFQDEIDHQLSVLNLARANYWVGQLTTPVGSFSVDAFLYNSGADNFLWITEPTQNQHGKNFEISWMFKDSSRFDPNAGNINGDSIYQSLINVTQFAVTNDPANGAVNSLNVQFNNDLTFPAAYSLNLSRQSSLAIPDYLTVVQPLYLQGAVEGLGKCSSLAPQGNNYVIQLRTRMNIGVSGGPWTLTPAPERNAWFLNYAVEFELDQTGVLMRILSVKVSKPFLGRAQGTDRKRGFN
jgi:hypothetical protein